MALAPEEDLVFGDVSSSVAGFRTDTQISNAEMDFSERDGRLERWTSDGPMGQALSIEEEIKRSAGSYIECCSRFWRHALAARMYQQVKTANLGTSFLLWRIKKSNPPLIWMNTRLHLTRTRNFTR